MFQITTRKWLVYLAMLLFIGVVAGCAQKPAEQPKEKGSEAGKAVRGVTSDTIIFGISTDQTGPMANLGKSWVAAFDSYFKYINDQGGVHGRKIKLVIEDNQMSVDVAVAAFKKLVESDNIFAASVHGSQASVASLPQVERYQVPMFAVGGAEPIYNPPKKYAFLINTSYEVEGAIAVDYLAEKLGAPPGTKIAAMVMSEASGTSALEKGIRPSAQFHKYEIVTEQKYGKTDIDMSSGLLAIKQANPEYLFVEGTPRAIGIILKQANQLGLKVKAIIGVGGGLSQEVVQIPGAEVLRKFNYTTLCPHALWTDKDVPGIQKMIEITQKYHPEAVQQAEKWFVPAWLSAMVMVEGFKRAGENLTPDTFVQAIESIKDFDTGGIFAPITFGPGRHLASGGEKVYQVDSKGQFIKVWEEEEPLMVKKQ